MYKQEREIEERKRGKGGRRRKRWLFSSWCQTIPSFGWFDSLESNCKESLRNNDCGVNGRTCFFVITLRWSGAGSPSWLLINNSLVADALPQRTNACLTAMPWLTLSYLTIMPTQSGYLLKSDPHAAFTVFLHPVAGDIPLMSSSDVIKPVSPLLPTFPCACMLLFPKDSPVASAPCCRDLYLTKCPEVQV